MQDSDEINYSIYNENNEYCGNIILKSPRSQTPEIGIDLMAAKRNNGIAAACIKLLARTVHGKCNNVEYFILRVFSNNLHSRHVIEKMGGIFLCEEDTLYKRMIKLLKEMADESTDEKEKKKYESFLSEKLADNNVIYRYKLPADVYL